jgi:integrase/recombinase XerD
LLDTGLRVSQLYAPTSEDILWQRRRLRVRGKGGPYGKKTNARVVPMSRWLGAPMGHHVALKKEFPVKERRPQELVKQVDNRAGLAKDVTPHVLRHVFAATALLKGLSLATVQEILGHDRSQTTAIRLNFTEIHFQEELERTWRRRGCPLMPGQLFTDAERRRPGGTLTCVHSRNCGCCSPAGFRVRDRAGWCRSSRGPICSPGRDRLVWASSSDPCDLPSQWG